MAGLYKLGNITVSDLAKETMINRTTLYPILDKLSKKGLVSQIKVEGKTFLKAISPQDFKEWVKRRKEKILKQADEVIDWIENKEKSAGTSLLSEIYYYNGTEAVKNLYNDSLRDNPEKIIYGFSDYKKAFEVLDSYLINEYIPGRVRRGIKFRGLLNDSEKAREEKSKFASRLQELRFIEELKGLEIEINVYGSKLTIVDYKKNKPSGLLVKNPKIAQAFKNIFEYLWTQGKELD